MSLSCLQCKRLNSGYVPPKSIEDEWTWNAMKLGMEKETLDWWMEPGIDVVIAPAGPHTAVLPRDWTMDTYTVAWDAMDVSFPPECQEERSC